MPTCSLKDLLESKDGTASWSTMVATVTKAPATVKSSPGARGSLWIRATLTVASAGVSADLIWTDPPQPYLDNPKAIEGQTISIAQGVTVETYQDKRRLRARGGEIALYGGAEPAPAPSVAPAPSSGGTGTFQAPAQYLPPAGPAQAHPLMSPPPQLTDRAILEAYAAWAPKLWALLDPGLLATGEHAQAVAACLNTLTIAVGQGKVAPTMFAEDRPLSGDFDE